MPVKKAAKRAGAKKASAKRVKKAVPRKARAERSGKIPASVRRRAAAKRPPSSFELAVHAILDELGVPYVKEKKISRVQVDLLLGPKTIVELQGCYWHYHKTCQTRPPTASQLKVLKSDPKRFFILHKLGYTVHQIWECEMENPDRVRQKLVQIAKGVR